jgi:hypothetical protein
MLLMASAFGLCCFPHGAQAAGCPNEHLRTGLSADLPDCRAYELVTPPDTDGRLVGAINTFAFPQTQEVFPTELASPSGGSFAYLAYSSPLLDPGGANGIADAYQAARGAGGWATIRRIGIPGSQAVRVLPGGVSADHLYAFNTVEGNENVFAFGGPTDFLVNPDGSFELTGFGSLGEEPFAEGRYISDGGEHVIFSTGKSLEQSAWCPRAGANCKVLQLEPDAPPTGTGAVYDREADGPTKVVSLLPGEGTPGAGEEAFYKGAAKDGSAVAFEIKGVLYVRVNNEETLEVAAGEPTYAGISDDGRYVFYVSAGNIHRFDTEASEDDQVNSTGDAEVVNVSADGSHVYFISETQIGGKGVAGQPNLYVWSAAAPEFIGTVLPSDLEKTSGKLVSIPALTRWTSWVANRPKGGGEQGPGASSTRTTADGSLLVFESRAQLTTYDNDGHTEIYRYDDGDKSLVCVSCNSLAEPATADARLQELVLANPPTVIHNVTDDGGRVFFETKEALVAADTDGVNDVYQWSEEPEEGGPAVDLISSGKSIEYDLPPGTEMLHVPTPNVLLSVTPDGENVVFLAQEPLVPGAPEGGTSAIYDARVNGGFPVPDPPVPCVEEGCRPALETPPALLAPQSEGLLGAGNVKPRPRPHCRRPAHRKHRHCKKRASGKRRARPAATAAQSAALLAEAQVASGAPAPEKADLGSAVNGPTAAVGPFDEYGIKSTGAELIPTGAGEHPDFITDITLNHFINSKTGAPEAKARTEEVSIELPPGLLGNPNALPKCEMGDFVAFANCPIDSQVGVTKVFATLLSGKPKEPVYNLEPPHPGSEIARFGFYGGIYPVFIDVKVRTASDYGVTATVHSAPGLVALLGAETTLWGEPANPVHNKERLTAHEATLCANGRPCKQPGEERAPEELDPKTVFMTNPSACQIHSVGFAVTSYQLPGQVFSKSAPLDPITGCVGLPFAPTFKAVPTNPKAGAPTGLKTTLTLPQIEEAGTKGTATMKEARIAFPEGMTIAAGAADGLEACSDEQVGYHQEVDAQCPDASKLGVATISSPALPKPLQGALYQRTPEEGRLFGLWLVTDELGLHVKLPGEIEANKETGQLTAVFKDLPQVPVSQISINVWGGDRAPLKNPDSCGAYSTSYSFTPHSSDPAVTGSSQMTIDQGCATGGFSPRLSAGATNPVAGAFSPMVIDLAREDGEQNLASLSITLPDGQLAKLAGVPLCPDEAAATGACPQGSRLGRLNAAVGPGPRPLWIPQEGKDPTAVYLAGPYKGAPFSVVTVVPAQAGPFDLGEVVVRSALNVDPETARATVATDPLPQFIEGVAAVYRRLHVVVDRPEFALNPTDCSELQTNSQITSTLGAVANPASRFQVDGCKALGFKPKLSLRLKGGTKRGDYPALSAVVRARPGDANIGRVSVALPHSEFLAQEHIQTICTRVRFAAGACPKGSVYGAAKAWTPLLDQPLEGPVYLRSSNNPLPDLVMALRGQIAVNLVGRIDSKNGGIRTNFDAVPDAPVTRFVLEMRGGKKSLLVNSTDLCEAKHRATVRMRAQNGRVANSRPVLGSDGCNKKNPNA